MTTKAKNEIEKLLIRAQAGELDRETFMNQLMESQLFIPVDEKNEIGGLQTAKQAKPLTLKDESGTEVLILFTNSDYAKTFVKDYPGYGGALFAEFKWIAEKMGVGYAISINPGHDLGFDLEVGVVQSLITK